MSHYQNKSNVPGFLLIISKEMIAALCLFAMTNTMAHTSVGSKNFTLAAAELDHRHCYSACALNPDVVAREMCFDSCRKANANINKKQKKSPSNSN